MTDWIDNDRANDQLVGRWDPDARLFVATGWTYGPAGPATITPTPGVTVSFDFADPEQLSEIVVEAPLRGDPRDLGPVVRRTLVDVLGTETTARLLDTSEDSHPSRVGFYRGDHELSRLALAHEVAASTEEPPLRRAAAAIEAAFVAMGVMPDLTPSLVAEAAEAVSAPAGLRVVDYDAAARLNAMIDALTRVFPEATAWPRFGAEPAREMSDLASSLPAPSASLVPAHAPDMPSIAELTFRTPTEVVIRAPHATESTWARVFRRSDNLLLGFAPFRSVDHRTRALVVIPPGLSESDVWFDLTEDAATMPSSRAQRLRTAIEIGRDACRAERLGDTFMASDRWRDCSEAWHQVADKTRAEQALARSQQTFRGTDPARRQRFAPPQPLTSDLV